MSNQIKEILDEYFALQDMTPADRIKHSDGIYQMLSSINQDLNFNLDKKKITYGAVELIIDEHTVKINGKKTKKEFAKKEFLILVLLFQNPKKVISREIFLDKIWDTNTIVIDRTIDVHIAKIKKKLGKEAADYIQSVKGLGYRLKDLN